MIAKTVLIFFAFFIVFVRFFLDKALQVLYNKIKNFTGREVKNMDRKQIAIQELTETCERLEFQLQFKLSDLVRKEIIQAVHIIRAFGIKELK